MFLALLRMFLVLLLMFLVLLITPRSKPLLVVNPS
jgi:hypothetical protein